MDIFWGIHTAYHKGKPVAWVVSTSERIWFVELQVCSGLVFG